MSAVNSIQRLVCACTGPRAGCKPICVLTLCVCLLLSFFPAAAWAVESVSLDAAVAPLGQEGVRLQQIAIPAASPQGAGLGRRPSLALQSQDAFGLVPLTPTDAPLFYLAGVAWRTTALDFTGFSATLLPDLRGSLYSRNAAIGFVDRLPDAQELFALVFISRNADDPSTDVPVQLGGTFIWRLHASRASRLGWGVSANAEFGDPGLVPVFEYATWSPSWTLEMRLPFYAQAKYWLGPRVSAGMQWLVEGGDYYITQPGAPVTDSRFTVGTLSGLIALGSRLGPELQLIAGQTVFERYQSLHGSRSVLTVNFAPSPFYQAAAVWRF